MPLTQSLSVLPAHLVSGTLVTVLLTVLSLVPAKIARRQARQRGGDTLNAGVLHIVTGNSLAGVEKHILLLARQQAERGMRVHIAFRRGGWLAAELTRSGIAHTPLPLRGTLDVRSLFRLVALIRRERIDIVHGHLTRGLFYAAASARLTGAVSIGTDHMNHPNWVMPYLDRLFVSSLRLATASWGRIRPERIAIMEMGVDIPRLEGEALNPGTVAAERASWGLPDGAAVIGLLGRVTPGKGHDVLIRALATMPESVGACLAFAGPEDEAWRGHLRELAEACGVAARVRFLGVRANVGAFLSACDMLAQPSEMEASPLSVREAMVMGRAVVASAVGGIPDLIEDGRTGILVPPLDVPALAVALEGLLSDAPARERLGQAARDVARVRFSLDAMERDVRQAYAGALAREAVEAMAG